MGSVAGGARGLGLATDFPLDSSVFGDWRRDDRRSSPRIIVAPESRRRGTSCRFYGASPDEEDKFNRGKPRHYVWMGLGRF